MSCIWCLWSFQSISFVYHLFGSRMQSNGCTVCRLERSIYYLPFDLSLISLVSPPSGSHCCFDIPFPVIDPNQRRSQAPSLTAYEHAPPLASHLPSASAPTTGTGTGTGTSTTFPSSPINTLIWVTGLFGTLCSTAYVAPLARSLPCNWVLVEPSLSSAGLGFGICSLDTDVFELGQLVAYIRFLRPEGKVVFVGWSTGCQDALHYVSAELSVDEVNRGRHLVEGATSAREADRAERKEGEENDARGETHEHQASKPGTKRERRRPHIDGILLQGPVSDRLAIALDASIQTQTQTPDPARPQTNLLADSIAHAQSLVDAHRPHDILPLHLTRPLAPAPLSAARWLSLTSPGPGHAGMDDLFSPDLDDARLARTFGRVAAGVRVMVVCGAEDEYVPRGVDQAALMARWRTATGTGAGVWDDHSCLLAGANHELTQRADADRDASEVATVRRRWEELVGGFLERVDGRRRGREDGGGGRDETDRSEEQNKEAEKEANESEERTKEKL